ncbi:hypothetical protein L3V79_03295 [Thiotrichales bacterium 19S9-12]|nr:hypothetical protein [Thiotrichales bacterium 19S9-11]MCF6811386.1 hypothetical protein [Thiotrichales bacterium 19S9-12]
MLNNNQQEIQRLIQNIARNTSNNDLYRLIEENWDFFKQFQEKKVDLTADDKQYIRFQIDTLSNILPKIKHIDFNRKQIKFILESVETIQFWISALEFLGLITTDNFSLIFDREIPQRILETSNFSNFYYSIHLLIKKDHNYSKLIHSHFDFLVDLYLLNNKVSVFNLITAIKFLSTLDQKDTEKKKYRCLDTFQNHCQDSDKKELIFSHLSFFLNLNKNILMRQEIMEEEQKAEIQEKMEEEQEEEINGHITKQKELLKALKDSDKKLLDTALNNTSESKNQQTNLIKLKGLLEALKESNIVTFDDFNMSEMKQLIDNPLYFSEKINELKLLNLDNKANLKCLLNSKKPFGDDEIKRLKKISEETDRVFDKIDSKKLSDNRKESFSYEIKKSYKKELLQTSFDYLVNDSQESSKNELATKLTQQEQRFVTNSKLANDNSNSSQFKRNILSKLTKFSIAILTLGIVPLKNFLKNRQQSASIDIPKASERSLSLFYRHDHTNSHNSIINLTNHTVRALGT